MMMKNYVISLEQETDRQSHIEQEFGSQHIDFEFFTAVYPAINQQVAKDLQIDIANTKCSQGEIACLLSHVSLWKLAIDKGMNYIGIFEDDICLGENSNDFLQNEALLAKNQIHILKLDKTGKWVRLKNKLPLSSKLDRNIYELRSRLVGGAGYILSNYGAHLLLAQIKQCQPLEAIDIFLFDVEKYPKPVPVHYLHPSIVIQHKKLYQKDEKFNSSLRGNRAKDIKPNRTILQRVGRELGRNLRPIVMDKTKFR